MQVLVLWLARWGHVLSAALWVGGYAALVLGVLPLMRRGHTPALSVLAERLVQVMTGAGVSTMVFGLLLVTRTRGFASFGRGEWGGIVISCIVIAVLLFGIGDGALRPAIRRYAASGELGRAGGAATLGFALAALAVGLMTRALYATT